MTETIFREMFESICNSEKKLQRKKITLLRLCDWRLIKGHWNKKGTTVLKTLEGALITEEKSWD